MKKNTHKNCWVGMRMEMSSVLVVEKGLPFSGTMISPLNAKMDFYNKSNKTGTIFQSVFKG